MTVVRYIIVLAIAIYPMAVTAHFTAGTKTRTVLLAIEDGRVMAYLRTPAPLLFSDVILAARKSDRPLKTAYLYPEETGAGIRYRINLAAVGADDRALRTRLLSAFNWRQDGQPVEVILHAYRVVSRDPVTGFSTAQTARLSLDSDGARLDPVFGEAVIEAAYRLDLPDPNGRLQLTPGLPALSLAPGVFIDNHMIDTRKPPD